MTLRYDSFKVSTTGLKTDENGFLKINKAYPSKAGVLTYRNADGSTVKELRPPEEVFREDSMQSLELVPFSVEHKGGILNPASVKEQSTGATGGPIGRDGDYLTCSIGVHRADAISQIIDEGVLELSAGYTCDVVEESGTYKGQRYDRKQTNIRYNHLTLTRKARGEGCRIRLDSGDAILDEEAQADNTNQHEEKIMKVIVHKVPAMKIGETKFDAENVEVSEELSPQFKAILAKAELLIKEDSKKQAKLDSLQAELKEAKEASAKFDSYIAPSEIAEKVKELAGLQVVAKEFKLDNAEDLDAAAIKKGVLAKFEEFDKERLDSDEAYRDAAFDQVKSKLKKETKGEVKTDADWNHNPYAAEAEAKRNLFS